MTVECPPRGLQEKTGISQRAWRVRKLKQKLMRACARDDDGGSRSALGLFRPAAQGL